MKVNYRSYKPKLREDFSYACGYCEIRESEIGGSDVFHIDHYAPVSKFPHLECAYENLIYSCRFCNRFKSNYWPNPIEKLQGKIIVNPKKDDLAKHIDKSKHAWSGISKKGKWTVNRLRLDSPRLIGHRDSRSKIEMAITRLEDSLAIARNGLQSAINQNANNDEIESMQQDINNRVNEIQTLNSLISGKKD